MNAEPVAIRPRRSVGFIVSLAISIVCVFAIGALFYPPLRAKILQIEPWTADWRTALLSDRTPVAYPEIVVVIINNKTLAGYAYTSPTPRDLLAKVFSTIDRAAPKVIGLDFYFIKPTDKDEILIDALQKAKAPVVIGAIDRRYPQFAAAELEFQKRFLTATGRAAGYNDLLHDADDVVRYTAPPADSDYPQSFALRVANASKPVELVEPTRIAWLLGRGADLDPFPTMPAEALFVEAGMDAPAIEQARRLSEQLNNKVVLISGEYPYLDRHRTPLSLRTGSNMLGVKIHAHIVAQLLDGRRYSVLSAARQELLLAGLACFGFALGWLFWRRRVDFLSLSVATVALVAIDAATYTGARLVLPFTLALWAWFIGVTAGHHLHTVYHAIASGRLRQSA